MPIPYSFNRVGINYTITVSVLWNVCGVFLTGQGGQAGGLISSGMILSGISMGTNQQLHVFSGGIASGITC